MASGVTVPEAPPVALALAKAAADAAEDLDAAAEATRLEATAAAFIDEDGAAGTEAATNEAPAEEAEADART